MSSNGGLKRSRRNALIGGVCGGIAEHYGWSATATRVVYVLVSILSVVALALIGILVIVVNR